MSFQKNHLAMAAIVIAMLIYGSNFPITRYATQHGLSPLDITALRFLTAGLLLLPVFVRAGIRDCAGIGWGRGLLLTIMSGVPMSLMMIFGLSLAPAAHGAAIAPGIVTVMGAIGSVILFAARPTKVQMAGVAIVLCGLACIGVAGSSSGSRNVMLGDLCFLGVGIVWGCYPLMIQKWKADPLLATAVLSVVSLVYLPFYFAFADVGLWRAPIGLVLFHALNQGVLNIIIGLWLWGWAVQVLGANLVGRFPPLIPVIGTMLAIPILAEWPLPLQLTGVILIVGGLLISALRRSPPPLATPRG